VQAVAWSATSQACCERRRATLEVGTRAQNAVGVDNHTGIAEGHVVTANRTHDGLIVDAGVRHHDAHLLTGRNGATLEIGHAFGLPELFVVAQVDTARVGDHWNDHPAFLARPLCHALEELHAGDTQGLRIAHHVRLGHRNQIDCIEHSTHALHVLDGPTLGLAHLTGEHRLFFIRQLHSTTPLLINMSRGPPGPVL